MKSKGYTLIEILVVLTVIGIIFGIGYAAYRDFSRRQALAGAAKMVEGDIRSAQQNALSGQKPISGCTSLNGVSFDITSATTYSINYVCGGGVLVKNSVTLPTNITIAVSPLSGDPILFKVLGDGTNIPNGGNVIITITQAGTNKTSTITIGSGGDIKQE
jgi:prepilin-type N-terminal cleavage/methylation domain-containing protein